MLLTEICLAKDGFLYILVICQNSDIAKYDEFSRPTQLHFLYFVTSYNFLPWRCYPQPTHYDFCRTTLLCKDS